MTQWFRYYDDALNDPKVQKLSGDLFKAWINLLCLASKCGGEIKSADDAAFALRIPEPKARVIVAQLASHGLLDAVTGGYFEPHNWSLRQFKSDGSNERVKRFREREKKRECNVTETVDETGPEQSRTETDTEKEEPCRIADAIPTVRPKRKIEYSEGFEAFWKAYPTTKIMSKSEAWDEWRKLSSEDHGAAMAGVPGFVAFLRANPEHAVIHACRFLKKRRFDAFAAAPEAPAQEPINVLEGTPEMDAWDRHWRQTKGVNAPRSKHGGIFVETQWPPGGEHERGADREIAPQQAVLRAGSGSIATSRLPQFGAE